MTKKSFRAKLATPFIVIANWITRKNPYNDPSLQQLKEMACARDGHLWTNYKDPNKKIKDRTYCRRCGQMYHEHDYICNQE